MMAIDAADMRSGQTGVAELKQLSPAEVMEKYSAGLVSRRDLMKLFGALGMTAMGAQLFGEGAGAAGELNAFVWEGYTDESFASEFTEAHDVTINTTFMAISDDAFAELQAGGGANFDVVSASNDVNQRLFDAGLVQPIDPARLTNFPDLYEQFQHPEYITFNDQLYGVNFAWGPTLLAYDTEVITEAPTSWNALFDEQYSGKIGVWNYPIQIAKYALLLDPIPEDPYVLDDEQLAQIKDLLIRQRPLVRAYWDFAAEGADLFVNGDIVISDPLSLTVALANQQGKSIGAVIPDEGTTGWSDSWMITTGARDVDRCYEWIDFMIGPGGQMGVIEHNHYAVTNRKVVEALDPARRTELFLDDVAGNFEKLHMWTHVPNLDKWIQVWQEGTAG
ncbi:MAG: extracellular solute-binding protein [Thermomicrobiales bacterium]|nr:extracellular solute-binding protein [Thermomicrobiales bacterium]